VSDSRLPIRLQVYVLNRDSAANLTISSPLEAHKSHNITFDIVGLDCGFDNPIFAAIELDYSDADQVLTPELDAHCRQNSSTSLLLYV
jgi:splicing factor 3B subunit 3